MHTSLLHAKLLRQYVQVREKQMKFEFTADALLFFHTSATSSRPWYTAAQAHTIFCQPLAYCSGHSTHSPLRLSALPIWLLLLCMTSWLHAHSMTSCNKCCRYGSRQKSQGTSSALPAGGKALLTRLSQLQSALSPKRLPEGLLDKEAPAYTTAAPGTGASCTAGAPEGGAGSVVLAQAVVQTDAGTDDPPGDRSSLVSAPVPEPLSLGAYQASTQVDPPAHISSTAFDVDCQAGCLPLSPPDMYTCSCCQVVIC